MAQDIYQAISGNALNNGAITVLYENKRYSYLDTSTSNENIPDINTISGKYDTRFDDPAYYE